MDDNYYIAFNKFIFRIPLFPFRSIYHIDLKDNLFEEAIYIASPNLYNLKDKQIEKIQQALYKYYLRASTRSTPFGLFASCSFGEIKGKECLCKIFPPEQIKKSMRLDMDYLSALTQYIESIPEIQDNLIYYPNDSIYDINDKIRYVEYYNKGVIRIHQIQEVSDVHYIKKVLERAYYGGTIKDLAQTIIEKDITLDDAENFVKQLIRSQILKSEIEIHLTGDDALKALIKTLDSKNIYRQDINSSLHRIYDLINYAATLNIHDEVI